MSKNYLVTGGAGFIDSHIVDLLLEKKKNIYVIDNFNTGGKIKKLNYSSMILAFIIQILRISLKK
tara:strand:- start:33 stop:227 length:195 start_codon:yes stop_codon:yes gene_type:complete